MEQDFDKIYTRLRPALEALETQRLALKAQGNRKGLIVAAIVFLIGLYICIGNGGNLPAIAIAAVIAIICWYSCVSAKSRQLSVFYKQNIISAIISQLCENASFQPENGIPEQTFRASGLFGTPPDRYHSEDLICGKINKTSFTCSEITAEKKRVTTDSKGRRHEHWVDIFRGFFFIADFNKNFQGQTVVFRNSWFKLNLNKQRVKLENPNFEKQFDVFSTDQVEARYILTPNLMERLLELDSRFPGKITVSFKDSSVIVAIPDKTDHFETSIWECQSDTGKLKQEFGTLVSLFQIIHDLNLNLRIWTKD
ncbi:MAG: DUF3137 domain-containing protein [Odoribacter sp.]|nr:DUF3137 domain-containing protein [Odoribacter sp.]